MCRTIFWKSRTCDHCWLELEKPCRKGKDLVTCRDFSEDQPRGLAEMPRFPGQWAPENECPLCDYKEHDMRRQRICQKGVQSYLIQRGAATHAKTKRKKRRTLIMAKARKYKLEGPKYELEAIIEERDTEDGKEYLAKWTYYSVGDATWEPVHSFQKEQLEEWKREKRNLAHTFEMGDSVSDAELRTASEIQRGPPELDVANHSGASHESHADNGHAQSGSDLSGGERDEKREPETDADRTVDAELSDNIVVAPAPLTIAPRGGREQDNQSIRVEAHPTPEHGQGAASPTADDADMTAAQPVVPRSADPKRVRFAAGVGHPHDPEESAPIRVGQSSTTPRRRSALHKTRIPNVKPGKKADTAATATPNTSQPAGQEELSEEDDCDIPLPAGHTVLLQRRPPDLITGEMEDDFRVGWKPRSGYRQLKPFWVTKESVTSNAMIAAWSKLKDGVIAAYTGGKKEAVREMYEFRMVDDVIEIALREAYAAPADEGEDPDSVDVVEGADMPQQGRDGDGEIFEEAMTFPLTPEEAAEILVAMRHSNGQGERW